MCLSCHLIDELRAVPSGQELHPKVPASAKLTRAPEASLIKKEALRRLDMPAQQLIAEQSVVHSPQRAQRRAARISPEVKTRLVPNSSHFIFHDQPTEVLEALAELTSTVEVP